MPTAAAMVGPSGSAQAVHAPAPGPTTTPRVELLMRDFGLVGNDPSWRQVVELAAAIASSRCPILIAGEPGTGKSRLWVGLVASLPLVIFIIAIVYASVCWVVATVAGIPPFLAGRVHWVCGTPVFYIVFIPTLVAAVGIAIIHASRPQGATEEALGPMQPHPLSEPELDGPPTTTGTVASGFLTRPRERESSGSGDAGAEMTGADSTSPPDRNGWGKRLERCKGASPAASPLFRNDAFAGKVDGRDRTQFTPPSFLDRVRGAPLRDALDQPVGPSPSGRRVGLHEYAEFLSGVVRFLGDELA